MNIPRFALLTVSLACTLNSHAAQWANCANEGDVCRLRGEALVRFGLPGAYVFRHARGDVECSVPSFGQDPAYGQTKRCDVSLDWRSDPGYQGWRRDGSSAGSWMHCANEGGFCQVPGPALVRYGLGSTVSERAVNGGLACNNANFGDPLPGMAKQCEYRLQSSGRPPGGLDSGPIRGLDWRFCANEGDRCAMNGPTVVRYGVSGRYTYREAAGRVDCNNRDFGFDPAPGQSKTCEVLNLGR